MCPLALTYTLTAGGQPADSVHSLPCILAGILTTPCGLNVPLTRVRDESPRLPHEPTWRQDAVARPVELSRAAETYN